MPELKIRSNVQQVISMLRKSVLIDQWKVILNARDVIRSLTHSLLRAIDRRYLKDTQTMVDTCIEHKWTMYTSPLDPK